MPQTVEVFPPLTVLNALASIVPVTPGAIVPFSVQPDPSGRERTITFRPNADGTVTTLTANLESSDDNGVTWTTYPGGATLTFSALAQVQVLHIAGGLLYRINPASLTLGTATKVSINAQVS